MIFEWLGAPAGRCAWSVERDRARPYCWDALLRALFLSPPEHRVVKLQVTGPVTLCWALGESEPRLEFASAVADWLAANAGGQVAVLAERGFDVVLVVDEPRLASVADFASLSGVWEPLRAVAPAWGLHVCGRAPWRTLERAAPDLLSVDVAGHGLDREGAAARARLLRSGASIAWGVIPTSGAGAATGALAGLGHLLSRLAEAGVDPARVARRSLLSASCGTGANTEDEEHAVAGALARTTALAVGTLTSQLAGRG